LRKFVFWREYFEAEEMFCDCIQLLNKNSLWIWFVSAARSDSTPLTAQVTQVAVSAARSDSTPLTALAVISNLGDSEFDARKNKRNHISAIKRQKAVEFMSKMRYAIFVDIVFNF
jgi:hypothetical protein